MKMNHVQLVCFDLGRVLIQICDGMREACALAGVAARYNGEPELRSRMDVVSNDYECGRIDCREYARRIAAITGHPATDTEKMLRAWLKRPYAGVDTLIEKLRTTNGVKLACLSNTNHLHWTLMNAGTGPAALPLHRLHHRFASHLIGFMKPDARIYQHVEEQTGVADSGIVFFDDHPPNVEAARARGWRAFRITPDAEPVEQMTDHLRQLDVLP